MRCSNFILLQVALPFIQHHFLKRLIVYSCLVCCINSLIGQSGHVISSFRYEITPTIVSVKVLLRVEYEACPAVTRTTLHLQTPTPVSREGTKMLAWSPVCVSGGLSAALDPFLQGCCPALHGSGHCRAGRRARKITSMCSSFLLKHCPAIPLAF